MVKISIITINYNNLNGLIRTVESVRSQTFREFEYIIVDGNSTDGSREFLIDNQKKINKWISESDAGIYDAMNKGITMSEGNYLLFLNSGDELFETDTLCEVAKTISAESKNYDCFYGNELKIDPNTGIEYVKNVNVNNQILFLLDNSIPHQASFWKKDTLLELGGYDVRFKIMGDYVLLYKALVLGKKLKKMNVIVDKFYTDGVSSNPRFEYAKKRDMTIFRKFYLHNLEKEIDIGLNIIKREQKPTVKKLIFKKIKKILNMIKR